MSSLTDSHPLASVIRRWSAFYKLTAEDRGVLLGLPFTRKTFQKEQYLVREGQHVVECALLLSGYAYRQKILRDGSRQIISIHIPTEFVDLQNSMLGLADHNVQSLNQSEVAVIPIRSLIELQDKHPAIRRAMWMETLIDSSVFREWVVNVGRRASKARIAHLLCELAIRLEKIGAGEAKRFEFPLTRSSWPTPPG